MNPRKAVVVGAANVAVAVFTTGTLHATPCTSQTPVVAHTIQLDQDGSIKKANDINLTGKGSPVRIVWQAPAGWVFKKKDIKITPHPQFSQGHTGGNTTAGGTPNSQHHWCDQNNDGGTHTYEILLRKVGSHGTVIVDPVIVNDGGGLVEAIKGAPPKSTKKK